VQEINKKNQLFNSELEASNNALTDMKDGLEDELIDDDIEADKSKFIKDELDLKFTNSYILIVNEDTIINKPEFEATIPDTQKLEYEEVKDFSITKNTHTIYNTYRFTTQGIKQIEE
jgi:hypothetical protein